MLTFEVESQFKQRLSSAGIHVDTIIADGNLHRCPTEDKPRDNDAAYIAFGDEFPTLWFQNFRTGEKDTFTLKDQALFTPEERASFKRRREEQKKVRQKAEAERYAEGAEKAKFHYETAHPCPEDHPYLVRKGIKPHGAVKVDKHGNLLVPVYGPGMVLQSLQHIPADPDKKKKFLVDGKAKGGLFSIPPKEGSPRIIYVCEGYATACSIHAATGCTVVVAFSAQALPFAVEAIRKKNPSRDIVVCADHDKGREQAIHGESEDKNKPIGPVGVEYALRAAREQGGLIAIPQLPPGAGTDFNDLHAALGLDEVRSQLTLAVYPDELPVLDWIAIQDGEFKADDCDRDLGYNTAEQRRIRAIAFGRLKQRGDIANTGKESRRFYKPSKAREIDIFDIESKPVDIWLPFNLHKMVNIHPKNIISISGETNAAKTALLLNMAWMNRGPMKINYFSSEMAGSELGERLDKFGYKRNAWNDYIKFIILNEDFHFNIGPDDLNIIDYLEINDAFYAIGNKMRSVYEALNNGVAIIATQKKTGELYGRGGEFGIEKARLALSLFYHGTANGVMIGSAKCVKAKSLRRDYSPQGREVFYTVEKGYFFNASDFPQAGYLGGWRYRDKKEREQLQKSIEFYCKSTLEQESMGNTSDFYGGSGGESGVGC